MEGIVFRPIPTETVTFTEIIGPVSAQPSSAGNSDSKTGGGCLIATATFGTELAPQVQMLREARNNVVFRTDSGMAFMGAFNSLYYSFSPTVADWERQNPMFKEMVKVTITPMLYTLSMLDSAGVDSEQKMLGYGIGIILLNVLVYLAAPIVVIVILYRSLRRRRVVRQAA